MRPAPPAVQDPDPEDQSGLLAGQTDPAMRAILRDISKGLRERYGRLGEP
jgi:hypothetical protein